MKWTHDIARILLYTWFLCVIILRSEQFSAGKLVKLTSIRTNNSCRFENRYNCSLRCPNEHTKIPRGGASPRNMIMIDADDRSVYVGNVDYAATSKDLEDHFHGCGPINRVTILCNKFDGHPKGFAYIEFGDKDSAQTAMAFNESLFKGRQIKVKPKRTNKPGVSTTNRPPLAVRGPTTRFSPYYSGYRPVRRSGYNPYVYVKNTASKSCS